MALPFLAYQRLQMTSARSAEEVQARLAASVERERFFRNPFSRSHKPYEGEVGDFAFSINRVAHSRSSYRLRLVGRIIPEPSGCSVDVVLRLPFSFLLFFPIWVGWLGFIFINVTAPHAQASWPELGMLALGGALALGGFRYDAGRGRDFLRGLMA